MQKILVTGCNGFVGSHICQQLVAGGYTVIGTDLGPYNWKDDFVQVAADKRFIYRQGDITDSRFVNKVVEQACPETVIHLASLVGVNSYLADPLRVIEVNIIGLKNLLGALKGSGARIVFSSTSEIYGKNPDLPWQEDANRVLGATSVSRWSYSTSKATAEHMLWSCAGLYGLKASVVRYFNLYGPRQRPDLLVAAQIRRALLGDDLLVYDGGNQTRCFTYIEDAVSGTLSVVFSQASVGLAFNLGTTVETTVNEVTRLIGSLAGDGKYAVREVATGEMYGNIYEDIPRRIPDVRRAAGILGWHASTTLIEGLTKTIGWWRGIL